MKHVLIFLALVAGLAACKDGDRRPRRDDYRPPVEQPGTTPPVSAIDFRSTTGSGVNESPNDTFSIPRCGAGKLGYIVTRWTVPLRATGTMTVTFTVTASPDAKIIGNEVREKMEPGRAALYFQRNSHDSSDPQALDGRYYDRGYRQWSHAREFLTPGDHTFSVVLTNDKWTGGNDQSDSAFSQAMLDPANAGITLSGAQSAGHGVCMAAGSASITLKSLTVE